MRGMIVQAPWRHGRREAATVCAHFFHQRLAAVDFSDGERAVGADKRAVSAAAIDGHAWKVG